MKLKPVILSCALALTVGAVHATPADDQLAARLPKIFKEASEQYRGLLKQMESQKPNTFPKRWQNEKLVTIRPSFQMLDLQIVNYKVCFALHGKS